MTVDSGERCGHLHHFSSVKLRIGTEENVSKLFYPLTSDAVIDVPFPSHPSVALLGQ